MGSFQSDSNYRLTTHYKNSLEHILDELKIINLKLAQRVSEMTNLEDNSESIFHGLAISDAKILNILQKRWSLVYLKK